MGDAARRETRRLPRKPKPISPPKKHHAELVDELHDYASKTPDAIIRKRVFKEPGIREDDLAATQRNATQAKSRLPRRSRASFPASTAETIPRAPLPGLGRPSPKANRPPKFAE
ncbi:hypothetical protein IE4872_CH01202 [Rhizobium gallicum]|uniref:Uncharacterized protein n=1 Tax=Rhizobium gallicum TaxID=56730 RepID=A0A1L5NG54_9HYPH|nr:hypothetical protein IE4872_CH01202 [Rhizobium gallicum]